MIPAVMKAWRIEAYNEDPAQAIKALMLKDDIPVPSAIQDHQVLLKVEYASVNPIDWKLFTGGLHGICPCTFPYTPGFDVGGTVVQAGDKVTNAAVGDAVIADIGLVESCTDPPPTPTGCAGAFAEYVAVDASLCVTVPKELSLEAVTGLPLAGLTAYQALFTGDGKSFTGENLGSIKEGSKVLILGGSGGVGTLAIQMAKTVKDCYVACTSSKEEFCKELGADQVINYKEGADWGAVLAGQNYDLIFDCIGLMEDLTERAPKVLKKGGDFVSIANFDQSAASTESVRFSVFLLKSSAKDLEAMMQMIVKDKTLKVPVENVYEFKDTPAALEKSLSGRSSGKVLIKM